MEQVFLVSLLGLPFNIRTFLSATFFFSYTFALFGFSANCKVSGFLTRLQVYDGENVVRVEELKTCTIVTTTKIIIITVQATTSKVPASHHTTAHHGRQVKSKISPNTHYFYFNSVTTNSNIQDGEKGRKKRETAEESQKWLAQGKSSICASDAAILTIFMYYLPRHKHARTYC